MEKNYKLKNNWSLWYHSIKDNNWDKKSYKKLLIFRNFFDYRLIVDSFEQNYYQNGMFFVMKDDIFPNWEDPKNRLGGCLSFKISSDNIIDSWNYLLLNILNSSFLKENNEMINGISIAPKKEFNIIKIWLKEKKYKYSDDFLENKYFKLENSLYKDNI
mgnify:CR=1 FL=1|tara:strand:- start:207 stop:683 length:477 start_codon:yes stop_codon:yes gene_type:complete